MSKEIINVLEDLGFEAREIKIYLSLIKEPGLTALQISKKAGIDRTTTYDILERLMNKGIVSSLVKNKAKNFTALSPQKLVVYFKEKYFSLEKILPRLSELSRESNDSMKCELFQGINGLRTVIREFIKANVDYKAIGISKEYEEILGYLADQGVLKLNELKVKEHAIVEKDSKFTPLKNGVYRYLDKKLLPPITTLIYNDTVIFFIWQEPYFAIRIGNKTFLKAQEEYFDILWNIAKN